MPPLSAERIGKDDQHSREVNGKRLQCIGRQMGVWDTDRWPHPAQAQQLQH